MPQEGQIVRNKRTGQLGRLVNGKVVPLQQGPIISGVDPSDVIARRNANRADAEFRYRQEKDAREARREEEEAASKRQMAQEAQRDAASQLRRTIEKIDTIKKDVTDSWTGIAGLGETGYTGWMQGSIPGTAAYSLRKDLGTIDATQVLQAMTRLKELSPTGSTGFGALSAPELELLKSSVARLDPDMDQETFMKNLDGARKVYSDMLRRIEGQQQSGEQQASDLDALVKKYGGR